MVADVLIVVKNTNITFLVAGCNMNFLFHVIKPCSTNEKVRFLKSQFYYQDRQKVSLKNWDEKNGRFSGNNSNINAMNEFIDRMKYDVIRIYNELKSKDSDITVDVLRQRLKGDGEKKSKTLLEVCQIYNNNFEKLIDIEIKKDTFRRYALDFLLPKL